MGDHSNKPLTIFRWLCSASFFIMFAILIKGVFAHGAVYTPDAYEALPFVIFSLVSLVVAILLLIPETVKPTTDYLSGLIVGLVFPDHKFGKPALTYLLARRYIEQERYDDAIDEYAKIIHYYPDEVEAYLGIISSCSLVGEMRLAEKYMKQLRKLNAQAIPNELSS